MKKWNISNHAPTGIFKHRLGLHRERARRQRSRLIPTVSWSVISLYCCALWLPFVAPANVVAQSTKQPKKKYNVLFIIADDLRPELGAYGVREIQTPNIDRIAARGVRFDRAYAQYPLCNPSRSSLLTGRYPTQTGVLDNNTYFRVAHPDWVTLPQYFKNNGYASLRTGKIFHGGIDDQVSWTEGGEPTNPAITERGKPRPNASANPSSNSNSNAATPAAVAEPDEEAAPNPSDSGGGHGSSSDRIVVLKGEGESHGDYKTATRAIQYLERYKDQPFFLAVGFVKPHSPPTAPQKFFDLYDVNKITLPVDFNTHPVAPPGFPAISVPPRNTDLFIGREASPAQAREMKRAYYASVSFMDAQVGRVTDALDKLGLRENTIIVFWGDHGYHLGEKGKWSKAYSLFDIGVRVPFIVAVPNAKGQSSAGLVQMIDLYPTLAELCSLPRPPDVTGRSFAPLLKRPQTKWEQPAFSVTRYRENFGESVRTVRWHYAEWDAGASGAMLFDLNADPHELKNLADDPRYAATVREMKKLLQQIPAGDKSK